MKYEDAIKLPVVATATRPDGYTGRFCKVRLVVHESTLYEIAACGVYPCPAVAGPIVNAGEAIGMFRNPFYFGSYAFDETPLNAK